MWVCLDDVAAWTGQRQRAGHLLARRHFEHMAVGVGGVGMDLLRLVTSGGKHDLLANFDAHLVAVGKTLPSAMATLMVIPSAEVLVAVAMGVVVGLAVADVDRVAEGVALVTRRGGSRGGGPFWWALCSRLGPSLSQPRRASSRRIPAGWANATSIGPFCRSNCPRPWRPDHARSPVVVPIQGQVAERLARPDLGRWLAQVQQVRRCSHPVRLAGTSHTVGTTTGEILGSYDTAAEPDGVAYVRCGNRRARSARRARTSTRATSGKSRRTLKLPALCSEVLQAHRVVQLQTRAWTPRELRHSFV